MKHIIIFFVFCLFSGDLLEAQTSIVPFVVQAADDDISISQSAGEVIVSSVMSESQKLTQGFLQPDMVEIVESEIYIPNIFAPDLVGENKFFKIGIKENAPIMITRFIIIDVYDDIIYEVNDVDPNNFDGWWDGRSKIGNNVDSGVFRYQIEYTSRGVSNFRKGTITKL